MNKNGLLTVGLVIPPIKGHKKRGIGVYVDHLFEELCQIKEINVKLINLQDNLEKIDVVHYPYFDPFFLTLPLIKLKPTVITVHDLIPFKFPEAFPPGIRGKGKWMIQKYILSKADKIITDSIASKKDIMSFAKINSNRIEVIYLGINQKFKVIDAKEKFNPPMRNFPTRFAKAPARRVLRSWDAETFSASAGFSSDEAHLNISRPLGSRSFNKLFSKFNSKSKFILNVGDVNYNKNIPGLLNAFFLLSQDWVDINLVLVGNGFVEETSELTGIKRLIRKLNIQNKVFCLGNVSLEDLTLLYNTAAVYIQVSFAEGFGLPILEAMACGCPIVCSNSSSIREIVGKAAVLVDPNNILDIKKGLLRLIKDNNLSKNMIRKGLEKVKSYSWTKCARQTVEVYKKTADPSYSGLPLQGKQPDKWQ